MIVKARRFVTLQDIKAPRRLLAAGRLRWRTRADRDEAGDYRVTRLVVA